MDSILQLNDRELLAHVGKISHQTAIEKPEVAYQINQKALEKEQSLEEIEEDIKSLKLTLSGA